MRGLEITYEVVVETLRQSGHHNMFHILAKKPETAAQRAGKYGRVVSVRKVNPENVIRDIEQLKIKKPVKQKGLYLGSGIYEESLDLDTMLGLRRAKRLDTNKKLKNVDIDK